MSKIWIKVATTGDVKSFIDRVQPRYQYGALTVRSGKKYHKIVQDGHSVYGFIDEDGDIFKAAGWAKPAKHARGNIFSDQGGLEALDSQGFIRYLR